MMMRRRDSKLGGRVSFLGALLTFLLWFLALSGLDVMLPIAALVATIAAAFGLMGAQPGASRPAQAAGWISTLAFVVVMFIYVERLYGPAATLIGTFIVLGVAVFGGAALLMATSLRSRKRAAAAGDEEPGDTSSDDAMDKSRHERLVEGANEIMDDVDPEFAAEVEANEAALEASIAATDAAEAGSAEAAADTPVSSVDGSARNEPWVEEA